MASTCFAGSDEGGIAGVEYFKELQRIAVYMKTKGMSEDVIADMLSVTPERLKEILSSDRTHD